MTAAATERAARTRVLLVDDSVVIRSVFGKVLGGAPDIEVVATAVNGRLALEALAQHTVDVVVLDIVMPEMDGLTALPLILARHPGLHVVMSSSLTTDGAQTTLDALAIGASDFIAKPTTAQGLGAVSESAALLIDKVRALGRRGPARAPTATPTWNVRPEPGRRAAGAPLLTLPVPPTALAIVAGTGGPPALTRMLRALPRTLGIPVFVTQHLPDGFTSVLPARLTRDAALPAVEVAADVEVRAGIVHVASNAGHLEVARAGGTVVARPGRGIAEHRQKPAADPMLRSLAALYGEGLLAVVLTGTGGDAARGAEAVVRAGGAVVVQDEATSIAWDMPGAVANAGLASAALAIAVLADEVARACDAPR